MGKARKPVTEVQRTDQSNSGTASSNSDGLLAGDKVKGLEAPAYQVSNLDVALVDSLCESGAARILVDDPELGAAAEFSGGLTDPGKCQIVVPDSPTLAPFCMTRQLRLPELMAESIMLDAEAKLFKNPSRYVKRRAVLVLRRDLDQNILLTQKKAAAARSLELTAVQKTDGTLAQGDSRIWKYSVTAVTPRNRERQPAEHPDGHQTATRTP